MAGEYDLKNGLKTDWKLHDNEWKPGVDQDWKTLDWRMCPAVLSIHPTSITLPPTPAHGDAFLVENVNQVWVWNAVTVQFDKINLVNAFIFFNVAENKFKKWVSSVITDLEAGVGGAVPIGGIIGFEHYGILPLPPGFWWLDGSTIVAPGSLIDGKVAKDYSGRYPIGYGTPGGQDISTALYNPAPVGNIGHTIDIRHDHTHPHTHPIPHIHDEGDLEAMIGINQSDDVINLIRSGTGFPGTGLGTDRWATGGIGNDGVNDDVTYVVDVQGDTGASSAANSGAASTSTTSDSLSTAQNIQPESAGSAFIIRVL